MKSIVMVALGLTFIFIVSCGGLRPLAPGSIGSTSTGWDIKALDVARGVNYLTDVEKDVILELNKVRTNPKKYAELYIKPLPKSADVQECVEVLSKANSIGILTPEKGLYLAAKDHATDQSKTGQTGHDGSDGSHASDRIKRYGDSKGMRAETISYGKNTGRDIVTQLLVDAGVPSRGHRKIIMDGTHTKVGTSVKTHPKYGHLCVTDYAQSYISNK